LSRAIFAIDNKNFCYYKKYFVDISFTGLYTVNATELQPHQKIFLCDMYNTGTVAVSARTARRKPQRPHHGEPLPPPGFRRSLRRAEKEPEGIFQ
jgi:hypothetical protein